MPSYTCPNCKRPIVLLTAYKSPPETVWCTTCRREVRVGAGPLPLDTEGE